MTIKPSEAQAKVKVEYGGEPKFEPIKGTSMAYATNTRDKVIQLEGIYYLCLQGVWFMAPDPNGPWTTCMSVPQEIYTIPSSSPVYNVTYVTQTANPDGTVTSSYAAGYLGTFILGAATGAILADGSGYTIILTQRPTAEVIIMGGMVIIMRHLTITPPQEPTAGNRLHMAPTDRRRAGRLTILTPEPMREAHRYPRRMGAEVPHKPITRTPERMLRHAKVRTRILNGKARMFREETRALLWAITLLQMEL